VSLSFGILCFINYLQDPQGIVFGLPAALHLAEWAWRIGSVLAVVSAASVVILWARGLGQTSSRVVHSVAVMCQVVLALWAARWSLLG